MMNLTMVQALSLWTDLMQAEHGCNGFGGDTAEIYAYRLQPCNPSAKPPLCGEIGINAAREQGLIASRNLYEILSHFRDERGVDVHVACSRTDDGRRVGEWMLSEVFEHRTQVRIKPRSKQMSIDLDREIDAGASPHVLLHRLWTKAVGTPHYVKSEWRRLEALLRAVLATEGARSRSI